jgi:hypothetical protein
MALNGRRPVLSRRGAGLSAPADLPCLRDPVSDPGLDRQGQWYSRKAAKMRRNPIRVLFLTPSRLRERTGFRSGRTSNAFTATRSHRATRTRSLHGFPAPLQIHRVFGFRHLAGKATNPSKVRALHIGQEAGSPPPSSHTTVHTVPYTAVHEQHWSRRTVSSNDTKPSRSKKPFLKAAFMWLAPLFLRLCGDSDYYGLG